MRNKNFHTYTCVLMLVVITFLQGCFKDNCRRTYKIYTPVYKTLTQVREDVKMVSPTVVKQTGKIYLYDHYLFLNESGKGVHVFDNSNPAAPRNIGFINIPGNVDIAIRNNFLYADSFGDLVVFNLSDPTHIKANKFVNNVFPSRAAYYARYDIYQNVLTSPDSILVIVDYKEKDTTVSCEIDFWRSCPNCMLFNSAAAAAPQGAGRSGTGGSMAAFTIMNNYLYSVSTSELYAFNLSDALNPTLDKKNNIGFGIETVYPFKNRLFIGSQTGMFIYDVSNPSAPAKIGQFQHVRSCDPVIADDTHAYVTLRSGTQCMGFTNQLEVVDISNLSSPSLLKTYPMTNPHGLSKDEGLIFICDGKDGLKIYDAKDGVTNLKLKKQITGLDTYDVIAANKVAIVVAKEGVLQYDYSDVNNIKLLSKITVSN